MKEFLAIVGLCVAGSILYGIAHDQVTARICQEYFTLGHSTPAFVPRNPTALGLFWGIAATWWAGLGIGVPLACAAQLGKLPKIPPSSLVVPLLRLLMATVASAAFGALLTFFAGLAGVLPAFLERVVAVGVPPDRHVRYLADAAAHNLSYGVGLFGGIQLWMSTLLLRRRLQPRQAAIESPSA